MVVDKPMKHQFLPKLSLKGHSEITEYWVQDRISENPRVLWLGDVLISDDGSSARTELNYNHSCISISINDYPNHVVEFGPREITTREEFACHNHRLFKPRLMPLLWIRIEARHAESLPVDGRKK